MCGEPWHKPQILLAWDRSRDRMFALKASRQFLKPRSNGKTQAIFSGHLLGLTRFQLQRFLGWRMVDLPSLRCTHNSKCIDSGFRTIAEVHVNCLFVKKNGKFFTWFKSSMAVDTHIAALFRFGALVQRSTILKQHDGRTVEAPTNNGSWCSVHPGLGLNELLD